MPITGMRTARAACQVMRTATGRMAGPERPPVPKASRGWRRLDVDREAEEGVDAGEGVGPGLLGRPREDGDVAHVGRQLRDHGRRVALRTAATTSWVIRGSPPKAMPPCLTLGQEMLISRPAPRGRRRDARRPRRTPRRYRRRR